MDRLNVATSVESSLIIVGWHNAVDTGTFYRSLCDRVSVSSMTFSNSFNSLRLSLSICAIVSYLIKANYSYFLTL